MTIDPLVLFAGSLLVGYGAATIAQMVATRVARRTAASWDDILFTSVRGPVQAAGVLVAMRVAPAWIELPVRWERLVLVLWPFAVIVVVFWTASRVLTAFERRLLEIVRLRESPLARAFVPLALRALRTLIWVGCALTMLSYQGYSVAGIIAGLGVGGIALALASQKTIEHLFGAIAIGVGDVIREGELVKVKDVRGRVEHIGLRSTRIRTAAGTLVTIPNGQLADSWIETDLEAGEQVQRLAG